ncbi:MAG: DPP IV N-terminal domain-containing protein [Bacteroidales bacterium]|nr:DPP IV N-terminal domain-containing protein [Bacteroidales bacterium]
MKKSFTHIVIAVVAIMFFFNLQGQTKKLTLTDAAYQNRNVFPERMFNLQWLTDNTFVYTSQNALIQGNIQKTNRDTILKLDDISTFLIQQGENSLKYFPSIQFTDENTFIFYANNAVYQYQLSSHSGKKINSYPAEAENVDLDLSTHRIAYTKGNNLFISDNEKEIAITDDKNPAIVNGQTVHRNEFGIEKGTFFSPKGTKLAFYKMDESMVAEYPIVSIEERIATEKPIRYPMAGEKSHEVKIGIYDFKTEKTVFLKPIGDPEQYLTNISWNPNENYIYVAILNRDQNKMTLSQFDATTGDFVSVLFEEENQRYVEPQNGIIFMPNNATQFIWQSQRSGHNHLYLYDINGKLLREITQGNWDVTTFNGIDKNGQKLFFTATKESPLERHIYSYDFKKGTIAKLTNEHGTHHAQFSPEKSYFFDVFSSTDVSSCYKIMSATGKESKEIQSLLTSKNTLADYTLGEMTIDKIKSDNGVDLYYRLIKPVDFDPNKKYPVFVYVYGGPHAQLVTDSWLGGGDLFLYYMAQEGFVVFTLDNQGSDGRGHVFESVIHRQVGQQECKDQMAGINFLKQFPWVDQDRMGIDGWSYGGFMTINMLLTYPNLFKAGCAGGPVCDWKYYEVMYGERYMDTPQNNPQGYANSSLIERANQLQDDLLIIHGTIDDVVVWQHSLTFIQKCIENGIQVDYFVYPGHEHNVRGIDRVHLYQKIFNYFDLHLKN